MNTRFIAGLAIGLLLPVVFANQPKPVHYHANFALYVNGVQDKFDNFTFYEEVAICDVHEDADPHGRAHMHDNKNHVVHVHAQGVTWGHFLANLGYGLSDKALTTDAGVFASERGGLKFILNGKEVDSIANELINSEDVLLINYGNEDQTELTKRYDAISRDAYDFNTKKDPITCSGS